MSNITVQDLQRDLLALLQRVEAGESFLVPKGQHPLAEVRPVSVPVTEPRPFGPCAGRFTVPPDFALSLPYDILDDFEFTR